MELALSQAMPLALIANELITNAIKYGGSADIRVCLDYLGDECRLTVLNAGELPAGFGEGSGSGFGMRMARSVASRLRGRLESNNSAAGVKVCVYFPNETRPDLTERQTFEE